ncbi:hypothetical protein HDU97_000256 [Phlyctochytrium planicorne]|nr:hypothetical protein HDU97_000256 [Phlyctochytrium planicorne]
MDAAASAAGSATAASWNNDLLLKSTPLTAVTFTIVEMVLVWYQCMTMLLNHLIPRRSNSRQRSGHLRVNLPLLNSLSSVVQVALLMIEFLKRLFDLRASAAVESKDGNILEDDFKDLNVKDTVERLMLQNRSLVRRNTELLNATSSLRNRLTFERQHNASMSKIHSTARNKIETLESRVAELEAALADAKEALAAAASTSSGMNSPAPSEDSGFDSNFECHDGFLMEKIDGALAAVARLEGPKEVTEGDRYLFRRFGIVSGMMLEDGSGESESGSEEDDEERDNEGGSDGEDDEEEDGFLSLKEKAEERVSKSLGSTEEFVAVASASLAQPLSNGSTPLSLSVLLDDLAIKHSADASSCARAAIRALLSHADLISYRQYPTIHRPTFEDTNCAATRYVADAARDLIERHLTLLSLHATGCKEKIAMLEEVEGVCKSTRREGLGCALGLAFPAVLLVLYRSGVVGGGDVIGWWKGGNGIEGVEGGVERRLREGVMRLVKSLEDAEEEDDDDSCSEEEEDDEEDELEEEEEEEDEEDEDDEDEEHLTPVQAFSPAPTGPRVRFVGV